MTKYIETGQLFILIVEYVENSNIYVRDYDKIVKGC